MGCIYFYRINVCYARIQKFLSERVQLLTTFFFNLLKGGGEGKDPPLLAAINGPPTKHHLNSVSLAGR